MYTLWWEFIATDPRLQKKKALLGYNLQGDMEEETRGQFLSFMFLDFAVTAGFGLVSEYLVPHPDAL